MLTRKKFLLFVVILSTMLVSSAVFAASAKPWYAARLEKIGFFVFDPPFSLQDFKVGTLNGGTTTRSSSKGNIVLLNFWATWCPPCKAEIPTIEALSKAMKGKKFEVMAVNLGDSSPAVKNFVTENKLGFPIYLDPQNSLSRTYASRGIPTTYILDKSGQFIAGVVGGLDYSSTDVIGILTDLAQK
jgi:thiol-disulfide isomerase/thioredoxin